MSIHKETHARCKLEMTDHKHHIQAFRENWSNRPCLNKKMFDEEWLIQLGCSEIVLLSPPMGLGMTTIVQGLPNVLSRCVGTCQEKTIEGRVQL